MKLLDLPIWRELNHVPVDEVVKMLNLQVSYEGDVFAPDSYEFVASNESAWVWILVDTDTGRWLAEYIIEPGPHATPATALVLMHDGKRQCTPILPFRLVPRAQAA
jgi:hypothetical protein